MATATATKKAQTKTTTTTNPVEDLVQRMRLLSQTYNTPIGMSIDIGPFGPQGRDGCRVTTYPLDARGQRNRAQIAASTGLVIGAVADRVWQETDRVLHRRLAPAMQRAQQAPPQQQASAGAGLNGGRRRHVA